MPSDEAKTAMLNLYYALMDARVYAAAEAVLQNAGLGAPGNRAVAVLERVDGALAEAGELLHAWEALANDAS